MMALNSRGSNIGRAFHKDILMPNISKQFALQRVYKPFNRRGNWADAGRLTAMAAYDDKNNQAMINDY